MYTLKDFDFPLPEELIAQFPLEKRSDSRLLALTKDGLTDTVFSGIGRFLKPGDLLVLNNTRVLKARLFGVKTSGGKTEVLIERVTGERTALAKVRASKAPKPGTSLLLEGAVNATVTGRDGEFFLLEFETDLEDALNRYGHMPLPPYIARDAAVADETRYQTVFAKHNGAVAAPTAGLHFDTDLLAALKNAGIDTAEVTLHVGAGTFTPVRTENISEHKMHSERFIITGEAADKINTAKDEGRRVICVGTTSLRAVESAARNTGRDRVAAGEQETDIFITPGYRFRIPDCLVTNFHLPGSTLIMLVAAFAGYDRIFEAYRHAVAERYRFFSYGDAMFIEKAP